MAKAEAKEKSNIARITAEAGGRSNSEAAERARAWSEAEAKGKAEISRVAAQDINKGKAEAEERARTTLRVREIAANSAVKESTTDIRGGGRGSGEIEGRS